MIEPTSYVVIHETIIINNEHLFEVAPWVVQSGILMPVRKVWTPPQDITWSNETWTDNGDGTLTVSFETSEPTYAGIDYGVGAYTDSSFDYAGMCIALSKSHTIQIPDPLYGRKIAVHDCGYRIFTQNGTRIA